ncbi:MAG: amidohydrolase/deacetylase family metallohydrolase [Bryobacterales bacterium]|nr:amidohydrolase/deacetylase family metallohydrolase [Bryobacterales bacterium]
MQQIALLLALSASLLAQAPYDLVLKGGHVIDPKNNIDAVMDVAVAAGKVARVAKDIAPGQAKVVDLRGLYVTPGLIDLHAHLYNRPGNPPPKRNQSVQPDAVSFRSGVTTLVDPGTSGWRDFPNFREITINRSQTRVLAWLNIVAAGMGFGNEDDPEQMDVAGAVRMAKQHPDLIIGFKTAHYAGPGWHAVDGAVAAGKQTGLPIMVDFGKVTAERNIQALFEQKLRPGDVYTHCFSGLRGEILPDKSVNPVLWAARKKGIVFDIGHGGGSFFWPMTMAALQHKFYPDTISTDLHFGSMNTGARDLPNVMSKLLNLGVPFADLIRMTTWKPAQVIHQPQLGNLDAGAEADIAVFRIEQGEFGLLDSAGARFLGKQLIVAEMTLRKGRIQWDRNARAAADWRTHRYRK